MAYYGDPQGAMYEGLGVAIFNEMSGKNDSEFEKTIRETNSMQKAYQQKLDKAEKEKTIQENKAWEQYATKKLKEKNSSGDMSVYKTEIIPGVTADVYKTSAEEMRKKYPEVFKKATTDQMNENSSKEVKIPNVVTTGQFNSPLPSSDQFSQFKAPEGTIPNKIGVAPGQAPQKNLGNQYTFADGHKEFDSSAIPSELNKGKIRPVEYFTKNGLNWLRDSKRIAQEMGMTDYRGTPGQNYKLVEYLESKKAGGNSGDIGNPSRKFDQISLDDSIPNRFTKEDREALAGMDPDGQKQYIGKRNLEDLKKMLPGNIGLINKVFGTNYTSDDITGGQNRQRVLGGGLVNEMQTSKGMEIQRLIEGLRPGQADKFMNKGMELDNSQADDVVIDGGNQTVQMGRRKLLEGMVDNGQNNLPGTTLDQNDLAYVEQYKDYKAQSNVSKGYNDLVGQYNKMDPNNVLRNKVLDSIHKYVDTIKVSNPNVYKTLQADLDKFPQFAMNGGKIPMIADKLMPGSSPIEKGTTAVPGNTAPTKVDINNPIHDNLGSTTPKIGEATATTPTKNADGTPIVKVPTEEETEKAHKAQVVDSTPIAIAKTGGSGYSNYADADARIGYSSNSISKG